MQKQTKDQKHYRILKEDGQKDFRKVERDHSPYPGIRVTKKQIFNIFRLEGWSSGLRL